MCCSFLVGCTTEDYFGSTGNELLKLGEDVFNTGETGAFGGDTPSEPQGNEEGARFDDINVKEVEQAPEEQKVTYNLNGPKNYGVTKEESSTSAPKAVEKKNTGQDVETGTLIFLSSGHSSAGTLYTLELPAKAYYYFFADNVMGTSMRNNGNVSSFGKALYKVMTGKKLPSGDAEDEMGEMLKKYGIAKKDGTHYCCTTKGSNKNNFYKKYGSKVDSLVNKVNEFYHDSGLKGSEKTVSDTFKRWQAASNGALSTISGNHISGDVVFKRGAQAGVSAGSGGSKWDEWEATYECMQAIGSALQAKGYQVKFCRTSETSKKTYDGRKYTNRGIALAANSSNAIVHFCLHWDANGSAGKKGMNVYFPNTFGSKSGEKVANAMKKAGAKGTYASDNYTTLNWAEIPSVIVESGRFKEECYDKMYKKNKKDREKEIQKWADNQVKIYVAGVKALTE